MSIKQHIDQNIKAALLSGDKDLVTTLRGLKSAILYAEVAARAKEKGLDEPAIVDVLQKETKQRQDSADLYEKGGDATRRDKELAEKSIIEEYLPAQLTDAELNQLVDAAIAEQGPLTLRMMGQVIGAVKVASNGQADGGRIATLVKARLP